MTQAELMEVISDFRTEVAEVAAVEDRQLTDGLRHQLPADESQPGEGESRR
jgi:hypothetical protein